MMQSKLNEKALREVWDYFFKHHGVFSTTYAVLLKTGTEFWTFSNSGFKEDKDGPDKD